MSHSRVSFCCCSCQMLQLLNFFSCCRREGCFSGGEIGCRGRSIGADACFSIGTDCLHRVCCLCFVLGQVRLRFVLLLIQVEVARRLAAGGGESCRLEGNAAGRDGKQGCGSIPQPCRLSLSSGERWRWRSGSSRLVCGVACRFGRRLPSSRADFFVLHVGWLGSVGCTGGSSG